MSSLICYCTGLRWLQFYFVTNVLSIASLIIFALSLISFVGAPLSESDLKPLEEMTLQIRDWILLKSQTEAAKSDTQNELNNSSGDAQRGKSGNAAAGAVNDDLYDF
jgi:hypothetical protein